MFLLLPHSFLFPLSLPPPISVLGDSGADHRITDARYDDEKRERRERKKRDKERARREADEYSDDSEDEFKERAPRMLEAGPTTGESDATAADFVRDNRDRERERERERERDYERDYERDRDYDRSADRDRRRDRDREGSYASSSAGL